MSSVTNNPAMPCSNSAGTVKPVMGDRSTAKPPIQKKPAYTKTSKEQMSNSSKQQAPAQTGNHPTETNSGTKLAKKYQDCRSFWETAPSSTVSTPYTTVTAPYTTVTAPYTTVSAPYTTLTAPYTTVSAPYTTVTAPPYTTVSAPYTTVSAPCPTPTSSTLHKNPTNAAAYSSNTHHPPSPATTKGACHTPTSVRAEELHTRIADSSGESRHTHVRHQAQHSAATHAYTNSSSNSDNVHISNSATTTAYSTYKPIHPCRTAHTSGAATNASSKPETISASRIISTTIATTISRTATTSCTAATTIATASATSAVVTSTTAASATVATTATQHKQATVPSSPAVPLAGMAPVVVKSERHISPSPPPSPLSAMSIPEAEILCTSESSASSSSASSSASASPDIISTSSQEGVIVTVVNDNDSSVLDMKEQTHARLQEELYKAQQALKIKGEECNKLMHYRDQMNEELEELTAKLFEEANKMVQDANVKRMASEKYLKEANSKIEMLEAEVEALKTLVITSTPAMPNYHLHPQLDDKNKHHNNDYNNHNNNKHQQQQHLHPNQQPNNPATTTPGKGSSGTGFVKTHRRSTSHHNFTQVKTVDIQLNAPGTFNEQPAPREVDAVYFSELTAWRSTRPCFLDVQQPFLSRIIREDVKTCLEFKNKELSDRIYMGIINNTLCIEPVPEKHPHPRECTLTGSTCVCLHRLRMSDSEPWHHVCRNARNRLAAVCDFITYMRYITQGLVKSEDRDIYWEVMRLRKQMSLSRLGLVTS